METFADVINRIIGVLDNVVIVIVALAIVMFMYGLISYIINSGNEEKRKEGINYIIAGVVGLFIMVSVWGLVQVLSDTFGVNVGIPQIEIGL